MGTMTIAEVIGDKYVDHLKRVRESNLPQCEKVKKAWNIFKKCTRVFCDGVPEKIISLYEGISQGCRCCYWIRINDKGFLDSNLMLKFTSEGVKIIDTKKNRKRKKENIFSYAGIELETILS